MYILYFTIMIIFSINLYNSVTGCSPHRDVVTFTDVDRLAGSEEIIAGLQILAVVTRNPLIHRSAPRLPGAQLPPLGRSDGGGGSWGCRVVDS